MSVTTDEALEELLNAVPGHPPIGAPLATSNEWSDLDWFGHLITPDLINSGFAPVQDRSLLLCDRSFAP
jgi:hypothetical protein